MTRESDIAGLWARYVRERDVADRNALVEHYLPLVYSSARVLAARLPASVTRELLVSAGSVGLMEAVENFDPGRGVRFETFAERRIRGEMLIGVRELEDLSERMVSRRREVRRAIASHFARTGKKLDAEGLFEAGLIDRFTLKDAGRSRSSSERLLAVGVLDQAPESGEMFERIVAALEPLDRMIILLTFVEDMDAAEVGRTVGMTEKEVKARRRAIIDRLRDGKERLEGMLFS